MVITDVIREAETEYVIYFLLSAYINAARNSDALKSLPAQIAELPLTGKDDARSRFETLMLELDVASKRLDDDACVVIKGALTVFGTAVYRLQSLDARRSWSLALEVKPNSRRLQASIAATRQCQDLPEFARPAPDFYDGFSPGVS